MQQHDIKSIVILGGEDNDQTRGPLLTVNLAPPFSVKSPMIPYGYDCSSLNTTGPPRNALLLSRLSPKPSFPFQL